MWRDNRGRDASRLDLWSESKRRKFFDRIRNSPIHQISRITKKTKNPKHRNYKNIYQIFYRFDFRRVRKNFKQGRHLRFVGSRSSIIIFTAIPLPPFWGNYFSRLETWKQDVLRETASEQKRTRRWKSRNASFVSSPSSSSSPFFPRFLAHRKSGRCPSSLFFFILSTGSKRSFFLFPRRIFLPGYRQHSSTLVVSKTTREVDVTQRPLLQPVAHFGRWNGSSFEEVGRKKKWRRFTRRYIVRLVEEGERERKKMERDYPRCLI